MDEHGLIGTTIGNYRITSAISRGSFGIVYKAEHLHLGRLAAIKVLHTYANSQHEQNQFVQEARLLEQLTHPHILRVLDFGFYRGQPYLIAEYAAGGSLRDRLAPGSRFPVEEALHILQQVGQALQHAHQSNVIHRDLKPENILFHARETRCWPILGLRRCWRRPVAGIRPG